ncbi:ankyrin repeat-containing domain protein [Mycena amicta]|nr:ankyrin repeat-containing domain protein [Mycena amicta]
MGYTEGVWLLLENGANVNAQGGHYGNALQAASNGGHTELVQLLLEKGADVNAEGRYYGNALQAASESGHTEVVQLLLEKGGNINAEGGSYGNALQAASSGGHTEIVCLLLEKGANVNAQGGYYGNALQAASRGVLWGLECPRHSLQEGNVQGDSQRLIIALTCSQPIGAPIPTARGSSGQVNACQACGVNLRIAKLSGEALRLLGAKEPSGAIMRKKNTKVLAEATRRMTTPHLPDLDVTPNPQNDDDSEDGSVVLDVLGRLPIVASIVVPSGRPSQIP